MMSDRARLRFEVIPSGETIELTAFRGIVAGYTGRDTDAVQRHIDELAAIGVAPPPEVPMFYEMPSELFDNGGRHFRYGSGLTSGEVEPLYVRHNGKYYLGVGSDHTDRDLETVDIGESKRVCAKPIGRQLVPVDELDRLDLDDTIAECRVDGDAYQRGTLNGLRTPRDVIERLLERVDVGDGDFVCLGGTLPLLDGGFRDGDRWSISVSFGNGVRLEHNYTMEVK